MFTRLLLVVLDQLSVVERGQHVPVDDDERPFEIGHGRKRPRGPERRRLPVERQAHLGRDVRVGEVDQDELAEVVDAQVDAVHTGLHERADDVLEHRPVADRHQRLRDHSRVRPQPCPQSAGEDDGPHRALPRAVERSVADPLLMQLLIPTSPSPLNLGHGQSTGPDPAVP